MIDWSFENIKTIYLLFNNSFLLSKEGLIEPQVTPRNHVPPKNLWCYDN